MVKSATTSVLLWPKLGSYSISNIPKNNSILFGYMFNDIQSILVGQNHGAYIRFALSKKMRVREVGIWEHARANASVCVRASEQKVQVLIRPPRHFDSPSLAVADVEHEASSSVPHLISQGKEGM